MNTATTIKAKEIYAGYSPAIQAQHTAAWGRCEAHVLSLVPKGAKQFEAHHAVEHARSLYFAEFVKGLPSDLCERAVMGAYKVTAKAEVPFTDVGTVTEYGLTQKLSNAVRVF